MDEARAPDTRPWGGLGAFLSRYEECARSLAELDGAELVAVGWQVPGLIPCECGSADCAGCAQGDGAVHPVRHFSEYWDDPDSFEWAAQERGIRLGAGDLAFFVPARDEGVLADECALVCAVARDLAEAALVRHGYYGGESGLARTVLTHHAAAATFLKARCLSDDCRANLGAWVVRHLVAPHEAAPNGAGAFLRQNGWLAEALESTWAAAGAMAAGKVRLHEAVRSAEEIAAAVLPGRRG